MTQVEIARADDGVIAALTVRADEAAGPAPRADSRFALLFGAKSLVEFRQAHALLHLDRIARHRCPRVAAVESTISRHCGGLRTWVGNQDQFRPNSVPP